MELIFLGTSAGMPTKRRNMTALAVRRKEAKSWCLIDCAEATQHQLLRTPLTVSNLQAVLITHVHGDHCFGLPGLLDSATMNGRRKPLWIIAPAPVQQFLAAAQMDPNHERGYPIHFVDVATLTQPLNMGDFEVEAVALSHRVPSYAYVLRELVLPVRLDTEKLHQQKIPTGQIWGQIQQGIDVCLADGREISARDFHLSPPRLRKVIIGGDNDNPALLQQAALDADVLVHEATYTEQVAAKVNAIAQHTSAEQIARFAEAAQIPNLVLTHFSSRYQSFVGASPHINDLKEEAEQFYQGRLFMAEDFARFQLNRAGELQRISVE